MDIVLIILSALCLLVGIVGCILPMLPGPPISYIGILLLEATEKISFTCLQLIIWGCLVLLIQALDFVIPLLGSKYSGGTKWGNWGCLVGIIIGLFFLPWGIICGPFLGAIAGEYLGNKDMRNAIKAGLGSLMGFLFGTMLKLGLCGYFVYQYIYALNIN